MPQLVTYAFSGKEYGFVDTALNGVLQSKRHYMVSNPTTVYPHRKSRWIRLNKS
ncbi:hypothetical protein ABIC22_004969 [Paenibacillus sp. PvP094]